MSETIAMFIMGLKQHLKDKKGVYFEHYSWWGDTEADFTDHDIFNFDKMLKEIDEFSKTFKDE